MSNFLNRLLVFNCLSGDTAFEFSSEVSSLTHPILFQACCLLEEQLN